MSGDMRITFRDQKWEIRDGITARDAIRKIGLDPEAVLVTVNGKLVTDDVILKEDDDVKLIAVVSGGSENAGQDYSLLVRHTRHRSISQLFIRSIR